MKYLTITAEANEALRRAYYTPNSPLRPNPFAHLDNSSTLYNSNGTVSWPADDEVIANLTQLSIHWNLSISDVIIRLMQERLTGGLQ